MDAVQEYPRSMDAILLPILACLSLVLAVPPFAWHLKNRNVAACSLIFWVTLANVFVFINAMLWPTDDVQNWWNGVGLCDVEVKLTWAFSVGACGSLACIMRNLAGVLNVDRGAVMSTQAQRRRQALVDLVWCYACPIYIMAVDYVVQAGRYYIFTIAGCTPAVDNSWATVFLIFIWAPIFSVVGSYYCVLVIVRLHKYRRQFAEILSSSRSNLNKSRFLRLFLMALTLLLVMLPLQIYILVVNLSFPRRPYKWSVVHGPNWSDIIMVPSGGNVVFDRWIRVACGFLLFLFFGLGHEATEMYRKWLVKFGLARCFPRLTRSRGALLPPSSPAKSPTTIRFGLLGSRARSLFRKNSRVSDSMTSSSNKNHISTSLTLSPDLERQEKSLPSPSSSPIHPQPWHLVDEPSAPSPPLPHTRSSTSISTSAKVVELRE